MGRREDEDGGERLAEGLEKRISLIKPVPNVYEKGVHVAIFTIKGK